MEFFIKDDVLNVVSNAKTTIYFNTSSNNTRIDDLDITHTGEYEKGGILAEVKEFENKLFYSFSLDGIHFVIIPDDKYEQNEKIISSFGDVDVLVLPGTKDSAKIFENIEARIVIPYGPGKQLFLATLGQNNVEEVKSYKLKGELPESTSEFVNLSE